MTKRIGDLTIIIDDKPQEHQADSFVLDLFLRAGEFEERIAIDLPEAAVVPLFRVMEELHHRAHDPDEVFIDYSDLESILEALTLTFLLEDEYFTDWERKEYQVYRSHQWWWYDQHRARPLGGEDCATGLKQQMDVSLTFNRSDRPGTVWTVRTHGREGYTHTETTPIL